MWSLFFICSLVISAAIFEANFPQTLDLEYFGKFWTNSFNFGGVTKRKEFWITQALVLIQIIILVIFGICLFFDTGGWDYRYDRVEDLVYPMRDISKFILYPIYSFSIFSLIPSISLQVRRLRDTAKNPWWILISFVPFVGGIVLLIFYLSPSRTKRLPMTLQERLNEVEDLLTKGTIDEEEYKYMRKQILSKHID